MKWVLQNFDLALLLVVGNFALNLGLMRWFYKDEGDLAAAVKKEGRISFFLQAALLWEAFVIGFLIVVAFLMLMVLANGGLGKKWHADEDAGGDDMCPNRAYKYVREHKIGS